MDLIHFFNKHIDDFLGIFKESKVKYGHDELTKTHTLEISPDSVFNSESFENWKSSIIDEFINTCPSENICITPKDSIFGVSNPLIVKEGISCSPISIQRIPLATKASIIISMVAHKSENESLYTVDGTIPPTIGEDQIAYPQYYNYSLAA